jgi:2-C-methyl-D-erythritol 4-phosphate cytidylyltransferase
VGRRREGAPSATVLVPAAGAGERLGSEGPKALVELAGRPMVEWSLRAFGAVDAFGAAVIAVPPGSETGFLDAVETPGSLEIRIVGGGASRSESVAAALSAVDPEPALAAVHDAARPLVTPELIGELIDNLVSRPDAAAVIAAAPITDTVKRAREPRPARGDFPHGGPTVAETESRDHLWTAQTPQVFRTAALREALAASPQRVAEATDDAWLVEKDGGTVLIHPAPADNLKVTTAFDLRVAELVLAEREAGG